MMFTGIIKAKGSIQAVERRDGDARFTVASAALDCSGMNIGDSISVSGVCLTVVTMGDGVFVADVSVETLAVTALGQLDVGDAVNLEPALRVGERLGGHLVSGHIDCVGKVVALSREARSIRLTIEIPSELSRYISRKGSVCVDGVSLTTNDVAGSRFEINIIPHTAESTTIGGYDVGTIVNVEVDQLARYLERLLARDDNGISIELLRAHGYA